MSEHHYIECDNCSDEITGNSDMTDCAVCGGDFCDEDCYEAHIEECTMRDLEKRGQMRLLNEENRETPHKH